MDYINARRKGKDLYKFYIKVCKEEEGRDNYYADYDKTYKSLREYGEGAYADHEKLREWFRNLRKLEESFKTKEYYTQEKKRLKTKINGLVESFAKEFSLTEEESRFILSIKKEVM